MVAINKEKAPESTQVKRARHKLEKQIKKQNEQITKTAIEKMEHALEDRFEKTKKERIPLKNIALFDANQHTASIHNQFVRHLQQKLKATK